jgi:hypothetical protein
MKIKMKIKIKEGDMGLGDEGCLIEGRKAGGGR